MKYFLKLVDVFLLLVGIKTESSQQMASQVVVNEQL